jgi:hypothetical protein
MTLFFSHIMPRITVTVILVVLVTSRLIGAHYVDLQAAKIHAVRRSSFIRARQRHSLLLPRRQVVG